EYRAKVFADHGIKMRLQLVVWLFTQIVLVLSADKLKSRRRVGSGARFAPQLVRPLLSRLGRTVSKVESSSFIKSRVDGSAYRYVKLQNQLAAFLVSNKAFSSSVIVLSVGVGSVADPEELPGLSNLVQESLCLGTSRFFDGSNFCSFIAAVGGRIEMVANERNSVFTVEVGNQHVSAALDRLSDMIRNPSFPEKPFFAKTAEFSGTFESLLGDSEFLFQCIIRDISVDDHVFRRLSVLTDSSINEARETSEINLLQHVKNFHRLQYSSNIMTLVVASGESLTRLSGEVISSFSLVRNLKISRPLPLDLARIIRHPHLGAVGSAIHVKTGSMSELILEFPIDYQEVLWDSSPSCYLEYLLRDNSRTSLSAFLTNKGWILKMEARTNSHKYSFSSFEMRFLLTSKGSDRLKSIIQATFVALEHIKTSPIKQDILVEIQQMRKYKFDYNFEVSPRSIAEKIIDSFDVKGCSPEEVLIAGTLVRNSNLEEVSAFLDKISVDNMVVFVKHPDLSPESLAALHKDAGIFGELGIEAPGGAPLHAKAGSEDPDMQTDHSENKNVELRRCPKFNNEYFVEELSEEFIGQINAAVDLVHTKSIGFKIRKKNKLLGSTPLQYFSSGANYRLYSPTLLRSAILDYLTGETSTSKLETFHKKVKESIDRPVYSSFLFFNNVNFQAPFATFFLRVMIPREPQADPRAETLHGPLLDLESPKSVRELILSLEVLVECFRYSAEGVIKNMQNIDGMFSISSILGSDLGGVPFGFEVRIRGFLGSIFLALKSFSRTMLHLRRSISPEKFDRILQSLEHKSRTENLNRSSAETSVLVLRSIFEAQKTSVLALETDYSSVTFDQIMDLSLFLCKHGVHEGAIIGNVNPLQAYTILNQFISGVRHQNTRDHQTPSPIVSVRSSKQTWSVLDPLSVPPGSRLYYFHQMSTGNTINSNSLLYVPFSHFNAESIAFQVLLDYILLTYREKMPLSGVEVNAFPKINQIFLVGITLSLSGPEHVSVLSQRLLDAFNGVADFIRNIQKDLFDQVKKSMLTGHGIGAEFAQLELKLLYQVTSRRNILAVLQNIKPSLAKMDFPKFVKTCEALLAAPKFLVASQKALDAPDAPGLQDFVPPGFTSLTSLAGLTGPPSQTGPTGPSGSTSQTGTTGSAGPDSSSFINVPVRFIDSEKGPSTAPLSAVARSQTEE
ncbi:secreted insulinase-like peptidase, partial [Cryptosporidium canis]